MLTKEQREYLLPEAYSAALRAGYAVLQTYLNDKEYDISIKSDNTPITIADRESHRIIREYLSPTRVPLLSEEGREMIYDERRGWDLFWMVDPLDGTKEFIKGNGEFTINIALMYENTPVLGVIYVPYMGRIYFADVERGSFMKENVAPDKDASATLESMFDGAVKLPIVKERNHPLRVAISRSHNTEETFRFIEILKLKYRDVESLEQGSSYKFCMIAEGSVDIYIRTSNTYEWDTAAGELIVKMAGGLTRSANSMDKLEYNKHSLLNPHFICYSPHMPTNFKVDREKK